jgi:hypothetical protein
MNSASNFRDTHPELYIVPPIGVNPDKNTLPGIPKAPPFTVEPPSERPPLGFIPSQNIDTTPTLDGMIFPVDDKTMPTYQTVQAVDVAFYGNHAVGDLRPLLERETVTDEGGREITYQYDPISGLFLHQGYAINETPRPLHYAKTIDRQDHFLPPAIQNNGSTHTESVESPPVYMPRLRPGFSLH